MQKNKKKLVVIFFSGVVVFLSGCISVQEYGYEDKTIEKVQEKEVTAGVLEKEEDEWIGSFLGKNYLVKQCPVCKRRYPEDVKRCPYDGEKLEDSE